MATHSDTPALTCILTGPMLIKTLVNTALHHIAFEIHLHTHDPWQSLKFTSKWIFKQKSWGTPFWGASVS